MKKSYSVFNASEQFNKPFESESKSKESMVPKQQTIDFILNFSKSIEVKNSKSLGNVLTNLN